MSPSAAADLIVIGDVMLDVVVRSEELARGGDVHGRVKVRPGGSAANASVWAAHAGAAVRLYGAIGADPAGDMLRRAIRDRGVDERLVVRDGVTTGAMLVVVEAGERSMVADRGANATFSFDDITGPLAADAALVSGYTVLHPPTNETARTAIGAVDAEHVAVDAASWPLLERHGAERFLDDVRGATMLLANEREAEALAGSPLPDALVPLRRRFRHVVVKLGSRGAVAASTDAVDHIEAPSVEELDPTGAGDAFDGVLLARLACGDALPEAARAACAAGARVAATEGSWPET